MSVVSVYVSLALRTTVTNRTVKVKDVATIYTQDKEIKKQVMDLVIYQFEKGSPNQKCITAMYMIEAISTLNTKITVVNIGETEFVVSYEEEKKQNRKLEYLKSAFVMAIIFFGAAFSIMTFNRDVSVTEVLENIRFLVTGSTQLGKGILEVTYSIGLFIGILVFFNHFSFKKTRKDPTPIQIEMRKYEKDIDQAIVSNEEREGKILDSH